MATTGNGPPCCFRHGSATELAVRINAASLVPASELNSIVISKQLGCRHPGNGLKCKTAGSHGQNAAIFSTAGRNNQPSSGHVMSCELATH
jgi:hypothetical protein